MVATSSLDDGGFAVCLIMGDGAGQAAQATAGLLFKSVLLYQWTLDWRLLPIHGIND